MRLGSFGKSEASDGVASGGSGSGGGTSGSTELAPAIAAGGAGRALAEWIDAGEPTMDLWPVDIRRFHDHHGDAADYGDDDYDADDDDNADDDGDERATSY